MDHQVCWHAPFIDDEAVGVRRPSTKISRDFQRVKNSILVLAKKVFLAPKKLHVTLATLALNEKIRL